jgi:hypothetical protein
MSKTDPPAKKVDKGELIAAVERACELHSMPVTTSTAVAELDAVDIMRQQVRDRLNEIADDTGDVGSYIAGGYVFWAPGEDTVAGQVDQDILAGDVVDWDTLEPGRIPHPVLKDRFAQLEYDEAELLLEQHPEYNQPSRWELRIDEVEQFMGYSLLSLVLGLGIMSIDGTQYADQFPQPVFMVGAAALIGGAFFTAVGVVALSFLHAANQSAESERMEPIRARYAETRAWVADHRPSISLDVSWGD